MQFTEDENSRSYLDFDSINDALDGKCNWKYSLNISKFREITPKCVGMCQIYEQKLKIMNADAP